MELKTFNASSYSELIERIWYLDSGVEALNTVVPPHPYVNLIIPLDRSSYYLDGQLIDYPILEGLATEIRQVNYSSNAKIIGIRFYAYGAYPFFRIKGKQLFNNFASMPLELDLRYVTTEVLIDRLYACLNHLFSIKTNEEIKPICEFYHDFRWGELDLNIEEYCRKSGTSYSSLNRKFTQIIGLSPKKFERLIKFRKALCAVIDSDESLTEVGALSGYFDQAHFIREFKIFANNTPSKYQKIIKQADKETNLVNYNFKLL
ncbi:AraC family transcriptional regulator [Aureibacter tunicatorum]|uniref:AraC-like DNA-binding protein n=1 Tax=Aureibacter tunicatorum TaxID=866807 RepID=A0AAE4BQQ6_9BACT|nr:AraC family transcriptional regulator [Aureibacter tunicatorum]MDR6237178.1 AraC-like DNA-binding protein [Aureibacter tunicatorum]BDD06170.1 AraC family transcriptional regulator [Aureibacter tunicatorum]